MNDQQDNKLTSIFRILCLDGGGLRGIFTSSFLSTLEQLSRKSIAESFDLLVGTSTGGIIALALGLGIPAKEILSLYVDRGSEIFPGRTWLRILLGPKYSNFPLEKELRRMFGDNTLNDCTTPVCITSYELTNSYPRIWKDDHSQSLNLGGEMQAWQIALATSAAPIYLPATQVSPGDCHVDGGMFANNPVLIGIIEAIKYFQVPLQEIRVLSVGTGERAERIPFEKAKRMGLLHWGTKPLDHMLIAQSRNVHEIARAFLAQDQYERINIPLDQPYQLDDYKSAKTLLEPGAQMARTMFSSLHQAFLSVPATIGKSQKHAVISGRKALERSSE